MSKRGRPYHHPTMMRQGASALLTKTITLPVSGVCSLASAGLVTHFGGGATFGYVTLISGLFALLPFADLGMGGALVNAVARSEDPRSDPAVRLLYGRITRLLLSFGLTASVVSFALALCGTWAVLLSLPPETVTKGGNYVVAAALSMFLLAMPLTTGMRLLIGMERNALYNVLTPVGSVAALGLTLCLVILKANLLWAGVGPSAGILLTAAITQFVARRQLGWRLGRIAVRTILLRAETKGTLLATAVPLAIINLAVPLSTQSDRLILSSVTHDGHVLAAYSAVSQFFNPVASLSATVAVTLWPRFQRNDTRIADSLAQAYKMMALLALFLVPLFTASTAIVGGFVFQKRVTLEPLVIGAFASYLALGIFNAPAAMSQMDKQGLRFQAIWCSLALCANLALSTLLAHSLGASGPVWASVATEALLVALPLAVRARRTALPSPPSRPAAAL